MNVATKSTTNTLTKGTSNLITVNQIGNGLVFDGTNDWVSAPLLNIGANSLSISAWIKPTVNPTSFIAVLCQLGIFGVSTFPHGQFHFLIRNNNQISFFVGDNPVGLPTNGQEISTNTFALNTNQLVYIVCIFDFTAKTQMIYVNGSTVISNVTYLVGSGLAGITSLTQNAGFLNIGQYDSSRNLGFYQGIMYDLKIFNTALTSAQVTQLYTSFGNNLSGISGLVRDYNFNQKSGTNLQDTSTNNVNGTLTNFGTTSNLGGGAWVNSLGNAITY